MHCTHSVASQILIQSWPTLKTRPPPPTTPQVNEVWELSDLLCDIFVAVDVTSSTASILNLVAISIDR